MRLIRYSLAVVCLVGVPLRAQAQNNTAATSSRVAPNVTLFTTTDDGANAQRWYKFGVSANRSYCVETSQGEFNAANPDVLNDSILETFSDNAGTVLITSNDDNTREPTHQGFTNFGPSRICEITTSTTGRQVRLTDNNAGTNSWKLVISDTTLFAPWFFSGSGFEAFVLIKNTTGSATNVRVAFYNTAGGVIGTSSGVAPANGSLNMQVSTIFGAGLLTGGVSIAHDSAPGGVVASVTSLNFGTGVSFDVTASPRQAVRQ